MKHGNDTNTPCDRLYYFLFMFNSNYSSILCHFDIQYLILKNTVTLKGHSRSLKLLPIDSMPVVLISVPHDAGHAIVSV